VENDDDDAAVAADGAEADSKGHESNEVDEYSIASWMSVSRLLHYLENCRQT